MPQSFANDYVHIVFSTKYRQPFLHDGIRDRMFAYMGGICNEFESTPIIIGGYFDHVHILCDLSRKIAMMKLDLINNNRQLKADVATVVICFQKIVSLT